MTRFQFVIRWFTSHTVRQAAILRRQILKLIHAQRDLLSPKAIQALRQAGDDLHQMLYSAADKKRLKQEMDRVETVAAQYLKPHPHPSLRENVDVMLVAVTVALCIRTFFLQPMKIPTGSMQPTLYGITEERIDQSLDTEVPNLFQRVFEACFLGIQYYQVEAEEDGVLRAIEPPQWILPPIIKKQDFRVGDTWYSVWFPPENLFARAGLRNEQSPRPRPVFFHEGEKILNLKVKSGDHLFVNRLVYNFTRPKRGEIIVFKTRGIDQLPQNTYYIKRLVALGGETVGIGNDHHLVIDGKRLDASTPRFENVYTFDSEPERNEYFGHVNNRIGHLYRRPSLAPLFPNQKARHQVPPEDYLVMGDNTLNSRDSRYFGSIPKTNVIGRASFVYWPISERFGWGYR